MLPEERDPERLELILRLVGGINRRLSVLTVDVFIGDEDEIDLTSYRLAMVGEECRKLSQSLKDRHALPWEAIYGLRNIVVHNYFGVDPKRIWIAATEHLDELATTCRTELAKLEP